MTGQQIMNGLIELTNEQYHSGVGISKSKLDAISISPLNYWDKHINPDREPEEYKHCFAVGDGTHKLVLEPGEFEKTYAVGFDKLAYPEAIDTVDQLKTTLNEMGVPARGSKPELIRLLRAEDPQFKIKTLVELKAEHDKKIAGKIEMPAKDYKNMLGMLNAVNSHHTASWLLKDAPTEQSFFFTDEFGLIRKCRTDAISFNGRFVLDLKTTDDVSPAAFGRTIAHRRYHVQGAWYLDILRELYGSDAPQEFVFIAAQKNRPFDVAVYYLTQEQIEIGRMIYRRDLELLMRCMETNYWPGADGGEVVPAQLPYYEMQKLFN